MKPVAVSQRLEELPVSSIRKLMPLAWKAKADGVRIYHLNIGDPDIETPQVIMDALHNFNDNPIRYGDSKGDPLLIDALTNYYQKLNYPVTKENVLVTIGGSEACLYCFFAVASAGEEILTFKPFYSNYLSLTEFTDTNLIGVPTTPESGFHLPDQKTIESFITPKTKAILICTPNNPTGTIYTKDEMSMLVDIAKKHNLFLISDEVYREFAYDNPQTSLFEFMDEIPDQAIVLDSLSKRYSLCGARIGMFVTKNKQLMAGVFKLAQSRLSGSLVEQRIAAKLSEVPQSWITGVKKEYMKRRDLIYKELKAIPGVEVAKPEGAFYTIVTLPIDDAEKFCSFLLSEFRVNNETVMFAPAGGFYLNPDEGKNQVRLAYVLNTDDLKKSLNILRLGLQAYNK